MGEQPPIGADSKAAAGHLVATKGQEEPGGIEALRTDYRAQAAETAPEGDTHPAGVTGFETGGDRLGRAVPPQKGTVADTGAAFGALAADGGPQQVK